MSTPLTINCPSCGSQLRLKDRSALGKRVRCPKCSKSFQLKAKSTSGETPSRPAKSASRPSPKASKPDPPEDEDDFLGGLDSFSSDDYGESIEDDFGSEEDDYTSDDYGSDEEYDDEDYGPPARRSRPEPEPTPQKKRKKKRKKKKSRQSSAVPLLLLTLGGCIGGAVGAGIWSGITYKTGYEVGIIAWFVGICVGVGVLAAGGASASDKAGLIAAPLAILAVLAGKVAAVALFFSSIAIDVDDPNVMKSQLAAQVVGEWLVEGREFEWPEIADDDTMPGAEDYPEGAWAEAERRWESMTPEEQDEARDAVRADFGGPAFVLATTWQLLGGADILWIVLAAASAFRLSMGIVGDD